MPLWVRSASNRDPLPPPPPTGWEETTILAAGLAAENDDQLVQTLIQVNPVLAGRCLHEGRAKVDKVTRQAIIQSLISNLSNPEVALRVRIAAGEVLGYLGDPRLGEMVTIPAGKFLMGEDDSRHNEEKPQHELFLPDYQIGKYPLTNAEYKRFIEAGGYKNNRWWTEAGWKEVGQQQDEPGYWQGDRFNKPNQPVGRVSWYECVAYCRWLNTETGQLYRLPTEAEWEKAARGVDGWRYPWGNQFEAGRLNCREGEQVVQVTTPVGIYPMGVSPFGVFDCVGNVWEWCATKADYEFKPYPYDTVEDEGSADYVNGTYRRALRGDSWDYYVDNLRCTFRACSDSNIRYVNFGFRLVVSSLGR
ncbi:MAG: hypothetical protein DPW09_43720 [Anaerolineae bacterium]|nr:hypothetical protein [Anaerolineae bacterium]